MVKAKNSAISLCRVCSMVMIVLCHIIGKYTFLPGHDFLGDILDVGVYSCFAISGYLYGTKTITNFRAWMGRRLLKIALPASILTLLISALIMSVGGGHDWFSVVIHLLNLQGVGFLFPGFYRYFHQIEVLGPLWFTTVIMLCYGIVPILQRLRECVCYWKFAYLIAIGAVMVCYSVHLLTGISLVYFLTFAIGYFLAASGHFASVQKSSFAIMSVFMLSSQFLRLTLRAVCDGTPVYQTYALYSHMTLGIWILYFFFVLDRLLPKFTEKLAESRTIVIANNVSMYVYLTHYCFCRGPFNFYKLMPDLILATVGFGIATLVASFALKVTTKHIQRVLVEKN